MGAFICRYCGAPLELADGSVCECNSCGRLQSVPLIDSAEKNELLTRAEQLRREQRYESAVKLYEKMITLSPRDADLYWAMALCRYGVVFFSDGGITLERTQAHSFLSDSDYRQALGFADEKQRVIMEHTAALIDKKRRELSEITVEAEYDVLLCCPDNSESISRAAVLFEKLNSEGIRVFFAKITLKDKSESEWEPYICAAVKTVRVLIVAAEKDCFRDISLRQICAGFLSEDMSGRAVIPILYVILPSELPPELSRFQALNAQTLGFEQDLIASIKPLVFGQTPDEPKREKSPLVRRAYIMLSDREFSSAYALCDRIEPDDPAEAALIRLLCEYGVTDEEALCGLSADIMQSENYRRAMQYGSEALRLRLKKYALSAQGNMQAAKGAANNTSRPLDLDSGNEVYSAPVKPLKKRSPILPFAVGIITVGLAAAAVFLINAGNNTSDIVASEAVVSEEKLSLERAKALFDEGKYSEAEAIFVSLGNYDSANSWAKKCKFKQAEELFAQGDIESARSIFESLGTYHQSAKMVLECDYKSAAQMEADGDYKSAAEAFEALGTFSDSKVQRNSCLYKLALELYKDGDYDAAAELFGELGNYSDSPEQYRHSKYARAEQFYEMQNYTAAYELFCELDGWSDSAERATDALYRRAVKLYEAKMYDDAISPLTTLGDYLDSREMLNASWVAKAVEKIDSGDKRGAYDILTFRIDSSFLPAQEYITVLRNEVLGGAGWSSDIYFGKYYGDYTNKPKAVIWRVLSVEGNRALVVSENALDYLPFDAGGSSSWVGSSIRSWLNGEFYDSVFSEEEKALIVDTNNGGVTDKVFLLSYDEATAKYIQMVSPKKYYATYYTQKKMPKDCEVHSWGRDGLLSRKPTETGYERMTASPTEPNLVFPAMWIRIG